jgi:hypothetical protein
MADSKLHDAAEERYKPFQDEILKSHKDNIHSITITGSALTDDFDLEKSDVNSVLVLHKMDLGFLELLASLGKTYGKKGISAPLIMTPEYIMHSLDVFPIEFLNIKLLHDTLFGEDLFQHLAIDRKDLRLQCERELKSLPWAMPKFSPIFLSIPFQDISPCSEALSSFSEKNRL